LLTKENLNLKCDNKLSKVADNCELVSAFYRLSLDQAKFNSFVKGNSVVVSSGFEF
jgi:hypothetical protein